MLQAPRITFEGINEKWLINDLSEDGEITSDFDRQLKTLFDGNIEAKI